MNAAQTVLMPPATLPAAGGWLRPAAGAFFREVNL